MKRFWKILLIFALVLSIITLAACAAKDPYLAVSKSAEQSDIIAKLDDFMTDFSDTYSFSGSVLIAKSGEVLLNKGYGMADYDNSIPNNPHKVFYVASVTKQFTATAIMMLQERGLLSTTDTLDKYFPDFPEGEKISIHNLLTHTSGLKDFYPQSVVETKVYTPDDLINIFKGKLLNFEPGKKYQYSNSNYALLGAIIEKVSGISYEDFLRENIFKPLEMNSTGFNLKDFPADNQTKGYINIQRQEDSNHKVTYMTSKSRIFEPTMLYSAGNICTSTEDLYKWDQALYTEKIVKKETLEKMFTPFMENYGYGWTIMKWGSNNMIFHAGKTFGYYSVIVRYPDTKYVLIILSNRENYDAVKLVDGLNELLK